MDTRRTSHNRATTQHGPSISAHAHGAGRLGDMFPGALGVDGRGCRCSFYYTPPPPTCQPPGCRKKWWGSGGYRTLYAIPPLHPLPEKAPPPSCKSSAPKFFKLREEPGSIWPHKPETASSTLAPATTAHCSATLSHLLSICPWA